MEFTTDIPDLKRVLMSGSKAGTITSGRSVLAPITPMTEGTKEDATSSTV